PALRKLEASGFVKKEVVYQTGKPNKHVYTLTDTGREVFHQSLTAPPVPIDYQLDFLTRAFFFRFLTKEEVILQFEKEISSLEEQLQDLELIKPEVKIRSDENGMFIYSTIVELIQMLRDRYAGELDQKRRSPGPGS
ncbi:MAG: PadR family transcriptional regulator, partial [Deltaproteobacteria bacterium]|nr:PadR family transcriptional regulator [Deltaproteobacteria bacterium]